MKRALLVLLAAFFCRTLHAQAQTPALAAPTSAQIAQAHQVLRQCEVLDELGKYDPSSCFAQHLDAGIDAVKDQNWTKVITEETEAIALLLTYQQAAVDSLDAKGDGTTGAMAAPYAVRSLAYLQTKLYNLASADATSALALDPRKPEMWSIRCLARTATGDLPGALQDCQKSLQLGPSNAYTLDYIGYVYLRMKNYPAAIANYRASLKLKQGADPLYGLGLAEQASGDAAQGSQDITAAQQLDAKIASKFGT
jgi:tetratricopeptide (TPR) repeat protein